MRTGCIVLVVFCECKFVYRCVFGLVLSFYLLVLFMNFAFSLFTF
jgi:uncharacterized membrane protein YedE/YeeE